MSLLYNSLLISSEELYNILQHLYSKDYPGKDYPKLIDIREIKLASELAVDSNGSRYSRDMKIKDIKFIIKKMSYRPINKTDVPNPDWSGSTPIFYYKPTTTLKQALDFYSNKQKKDIISQEFDNLEDEL